MPVASELKFEICVDSVESAVAAQDGGAHRIELCSDLLEGGITPSAGLLAQVRETINLDIHVMIRPRGGDFCFSEVEMHIMLKDIDIARQYGAQGVVIGILQPDGSIDTDRAQQLIEHARPLSVTFHRAFDLTPDPILALDRLIEIGTDRVLTSGGQPTAAAGASMLAQLVTKAQNKIIIMPGSGIREHNIASLVQQTGAKEYHFSARHPADSPMQYRHPTVTFSPDDYTLSYTNASEVRTIIAGARGAASPSP